MGVGRGKRGCYAVLSVERGTRDHVLYYKQQDFVCGAPELIDIIGLISERGAKMPSGEN